MKIRDASLCLLILLYTISAVSANSVHGCGGFLEASSSVIKWRKETGAKLDYSQINVELRTADGLVKERTQCAPNGYYFIPGSFVIKISGPEGWSGDPDKVPVVIDDNGCNNNEDINFRFTGFTLSGRIVGAVGGQSCSVKNGGPANVNVDLLSPHGNLISAELTMSDGRYLFKNIIPGIVEKKSFFFYPRLHHVAVTNDGCQASVPLFSGRLGLYLEGSVSPPISGVHIQIIAGDEGDIASVMKGVMLETATEADGSFVAGPLYDDITYNIKASKCNKINRFESEIIEVDLEKNSQVHVGPLKYSVEEYHHKQELTPAPVFPLIVGVSVIILFLSIPKT
ncbi:hypothetical protein V6N11_025547 [Hibiscus sabdariffa]|uniref:Uncharacterized protein n=1 Tax=Hibiscus sabdariffa TaxID=183260 RepID=A0ABR2NIP1_9ROSI